MSDSEFLSRANRTREKRSRVMEGRDIELPFCKYAKVNGCQPLKLTLLRKKGFPDRTVLCPEGRLFFIEFKRPDLGKRRDKSLMSTQSLVRRMLEGLGFEYHVCDNLETAKAILDDFLIGGL